MNLRTASRVSLGVQAGDPEADAAVKPHYMDLRTRLGSRCHGNYGAGFNELGIVLRIDGRIWHWEKSGCANLRVTKKGDVSIDIFMPKTVWHKTGSRGIRDFLAVEALNAAQMTIGRLKQKKLAFKASEFEADFASAIAEFTSANSGETS